MEAFYLVNSEIFGLSGSTAVVYNFLCRANNVSTGKSFYGKKAIARACNISKSTVVRAIRTLCKKGLLEIRRRFDHGRQTSNNYILIDNLQMKMNAENASHDSNPASEQSTDQTQPAQPRLFTCRLPADTQGLSANALKVYSYLSYRADMEGTCKPAKKEIAADCGISLSTVTRAIKTLQTTGLIGVRSQTRLNLFGNNGTSVNQYILKGVKAQDTPQSGSDEPESGDPCSDMKCV
jgi:DNA-binding MarR family transcriptional regulator